MTNIILFFNKFKMLTYFEAFFLLTACGGGSDKTYPSYGMDLNTLRLAPASLSSANAGQVQLFAVGQEINFSLDMPLTRIDPVTGTVYFVEPPATTGLRVYAFGFGLIKPESAGRLEPVNTEWTARTVWILQGEKYVSTKDVKFQDGIFSIWFDDAPLNKNQPATLVVEFASENQSTLIQSAIRWN